MSAAKHTPGPWFVGAQNDYLYVIDRRPSASGNDYPNHEADTELVAKPFAARGRTVEANARLIAAAPELLQELKHAAELLVSLSTECRTACLDGELVDTLAAAERFDNLIAKATGEAA